MKKGENKITDKRNVIQIRISEQFENDIKIGMEISGIKNKTEVFMIYKFNNKEDLKIFIAENILNTIDVTNILKCSRQYIDKLVNLEKITPIKVFPRDKLFLKEDIIEFQKNRINK